MGSVYRRKGSRFFWLKWFDRNGVEQRQSSETESEADARAIVAEIERQELEHSPRRKVGELTVERWFDEVWLPQRQKEWPSAWKTDRTRLKHHFLPTFGGWAIRDMGTDKGELALLDWLIGLRHHTAKRDGLPLAPRTTWSTWSIVEVFLADALEKRVIGRNPCNSLRPRKHLPAKVDKDGRFRESAGFALEHVVLVTTSELIPKDRRVLYGLGFLGGGLRPSSRAIARWRDLNTTKRPLWRLTITNSYDTANRLEKDRTKTKVPYHIPVHPVLQDMLEEWRNSGWKKFMGREPTDDDFIVPRPDGMPRRVDFSLEQFHSDLDRLGLPRQRQYESRATFRGLALDGGAEPYHLDAITHPSPVMGKDFYRRLELEWPARCRAVMAIDPAAWGEKYAQAAVPSEGVTAKVTAYGTPAMKSPTSRTKLVGQLVTPTGLEPMFSA